jgi:hypothetical protein
LLLLHLVPRPRKRHKRPEGLFRQGEDHEKVFHRRVPLVDYLTICGDTFPWGSL